MMLCMLHVI